MPDDLTGGRIDPRIIRNATELKKLQEQLSKQNALLVEKEALISKNVALLAQKETLLVQKTNQLAEKEALLVQASQTKAALEGENANLKNEQAAKTAIIQASEREKAIIAAKYQKLADENKTILETREKEIIALRKQLDELTKIKNPDELLVKELTKAQLQLQQVDLQNKVNAQALIETKASLAIREEQVGKMALDLEQLKKLVADYQLDKAAAKNELELLRSKFKAAYSPEELSAYLGSAIESFNNQVNTVDPTVNYVINSMDIDLKTQVYKNDQSQVMFTPADIASKSENSLSSVKISIRAVPRM